MGQSIAGSLAGAGQGGPDGFAPPAAMRDFFVCDVPWAVPKDDMASMEHPLFTLATRPDRRILRYVHGTAEIEVTPSVKGLATIHDKDVLIYCISQLMAAVNAGPSRRTDAAPEGGRADGGDRAGDQRRRLPAAARGLRAAVGDADRHQHRDRRDRVTRGFGLIDGWEILRKARGGRMILVTVTLSDWISARCCRARC